MEKKIVSDGEFDTCLTFNDVFLVLLSSLLCEAVIHKILHFP